MAGFKNTEYKKDWLVKVPGTDVNYADGTFFKEGNAFAVYDGATNWCGNVYVDGTYRSNGGPNEYNETFLKSAKAELLRQGLLSAAAPEEKKETVAMSVLIGHARSDENRNAAGGVAGDQTGNEVCISTWYNGDWDILLRPKSAVVAEKMASSCETLCKSNLVGYDQWERNSLWDGLNLVRWDAAALRKKYETDCSAFMTVCARCAGIDVQRVPMGNGQYNAPVTQTMRNAFEATGQFEVLTDTKYLITDKYLRRGDILVRQSGHTAMVLSNGVLSHDGTGSAAASAASSSSVDGHSGSSNNSMAGTVVKEVKAKSYAQYEDKSLTGTYECRIPMLSVRDGAGTKKAALTDISFGDKVQCYGFYNTHDDAKWLYVTFVQGDTRYTGFAPSMYLARITA